MENKRDYIKFTIPNGRSGVVYIGVTNVPELEREKFRNILGSRIVTLSKKGRRTTKDAAERWKKNELEAYASAHNGQYPVYNRSELMPSALIQNYMVLKKKKPAIRQHLIPTSSYRRRRGKNPSYFNKRRQLWS